MKDAHPPIFSHGLCIAYPDSRKHAAAPGHVARGQAQLQRLRGGGRQRRQLPPLQDAGHEPAAHSAILGREGTSLRPSAG